MDVQIKIKILKYFVDGLQKPFYKNKEERISPNLLLNEGRRPLTNNSMPHSFLNIDDSIHLCIWGASPPPLPANLWFMGCKTFGSWVAKPLVHRYQNLWFIGIKTFGS
jgi:hypothetical protein